MWIWLVGCLTSPAEYRDLYEQARDMDGDGFPSAEFGGPDCDDEDAAIFPGAGEDCDDVDQDCDGSVDEGQEFLTWYPDEDGDGWGDDAGAFDSCALEPGHVLQGEDCDDWNASVHPGQLEVCDGIDQDCDGVEDDGLEFLTWYPDGDSDGYGDESGAIEACDVPEGHVQVAGDCDDEQTQANPGRREVCGDGIDNDCSGGAPECGLVGEYTVSDAQGLFYGVDGSRFGSDVATGDFNGDGRVSMVVGAPDAAKGGFVYLFDEPGEGTVRYTAADWDFSKSHGSYHEVGGDLFAGDVNDDGFDDLLIGNRNIKIDYTTNEYVRLIFGTASGLGLTADVLIERPGRDHWFGWDVAFADGALAVAGVTDDLSDSTVYLWEEVPLADTNASAATAQIELDPGGQFLVSAPVLFGDWDGDGQQDLSIRDNEKFHFSYGRSWLADQDVSDFESSLSSSDAEGMLGARGAAADLNGDGYEDFALGVPIGEDGDLNAPSVAVFFGSARGFLRGDASDADWVGTGGAYSGAVTIAVGDLNGDGQADLLASGAQFENSHATAEVYVGPFGDDLEEPSAVLKMESSAVFCAWDLDVVPASDDGLNWAVVACPETDDVYLFRGLGE